MNTQTETNVRLFASAKSWIEGEALRQLYATSKFEGMRLAVGFPDLHPGKGSAVGAAFVTEGLIYPYLIGGDIGCGMALFRTDLVRRDVKLDRWAQIPFDLEHVWTDEIAEFLSKEELESTEFDEALGTLGGGNHFAELQAVEEVLNAREFKKLGLGKQQLVTLVHSGSRGLGESVLRDYVADLVFTWRQLPATTNHGEYGKFTISAPKGGIWLWEQERQFAPAENYETGMVFLFGPESLRAYMKLHRAEMFVKSRNGEVYARIFSQLDTGSSTLSLRGRVNSSSNRYVGSRSDSYAIGVYGSLSPSYLNPGVPWWIAVPPTRGQVLLSPERERFLFSESAEQNFPIFLDRTQFEQSPFHLHRFRRYITQRSRTYPAHLPFLGIQLSSVKFVRPHQLVA